MSTAQNIDDFFEQWAEEFGRTVEMFTGDKPAVKHRPVAASQRPEWLAKLASCLVWKQVMEGEGAFAAWVAADEACWSVLGSAMGDNSDPRQMFLEMVTQTNQGAAAVASAGLSTPLRCREGSVEALNSLETLELSEITVTFRDSALPSVVMALEPAAGTVLQGNFDIGATPGRLYDKPLIGKLPAANGLGSSMMNRLMDVQLPVSVLLGEAVLAIRDVLKISAGSLIELDRQTADYVEIMIHGTVVARGEIVSVKGNYGVRIKEVISRQDRIALKDAA